MNKVVDLRATLGPVRDQGPFRGTCLAFAVTATHEHGRAQPPGPLSVETLYWGAKQNDGLLGQGTTFEAAGAALRSWGQPKEELWPYDPLRTDNDANYQPPHNAVKPSNCLAADLFPIAATCDAVGAALDQGFVVPIGIPTWPGLLRPVGSQLRNPRPAELDGQLHAVTIVGYRLDTAEILLRNSWGTRWGDQGHAWIPQQFVDDHVISAWQLRPLDAAQPPTATMTVVAPRPTATHSFGTR